MISASIRYGDSIACTSAERRKPWYDGGNGAQIWRLLERQNSQQKNPASRGTAMPELTTVIDKHGGFQYRASVCRSMHRSSDRWPDRSRSGAGHPVRLRPVGRDGLSRANAVDKGTIAKANSETSVTIQIRRRAQPMGASASFDHKRGRAVMPEMPINRRHRRLQCMHRRARPRGAARASASATGWAEPLCRDNRSSPSSRPKPSPAAPAAWMKARVRPPG